MYDLRLGLFYSYIAYGFFLPGVFIFLLFIFKSLSIFLIPLITIDTILFLTLLGTLYWLQSETKRLWLFFILIIITVFITIRNLYLFISIIYRTLTEFDKKKMIFSDAINRQINLLQEPQHPVWQIILLKQCCGVNSEYSNDYQWFRQTPFSHFCQNLHLRNDLIDQFENTFKMKYSPRGLCLPLVNNELKIELILLSISLGFGVFLMLLIWLFIWQDRLSYLALLKKMLRKQKRNSIASTNKLSITSVIQEPIISELEKIGKPIQNVTIKLETKRFYKGYLTALEDVK